MVDQEVVEKAAQALREGGVIIFPTDTVWGIGAALNRKDGLSRLYAIKGRARDKPTAVLVESLDKARGLGEFSRQASKLAKEYWPGAITIIVRARPGAVPSIVRGATNSVGLRIPDHELTRNIIRRLGTAIVAGSANYAGAEAPRRFELIDRRLLATVDYVIVPQAGTSGAEAGGQLPSTVVDASKKPLAILREGPVKISTNRE